jgi:hypothetical protein
VLSVGTGTAFAKAHDQAGLPSQAGPDSRRSVQEFAAHADGWVAAEKPVRSQRNLTPDSRQHRPVLWPGDMPNSDGAPGDEVGRQDRLVVHVGSKAISAPRLVRIGSRREEFADTLPGDPQIGP